MELDQSAGQREPYAEAALGAGQRLLDLGEQIEDPRQHLGRDPDAVVAHAQHDLAPLAIARHRDLPTSRCVLRRVLEQVARDLGDAARDRPRTTAGHPGATPTRHAPGRR